MIRVYRPRVLFHNTSGAHHDSLIVVATDECLACAWRVLPAVWQQLHGSCLVSQEHCVCPRIAVHAHEDIRALRNWVAGCQLTIFRVIAFYGIQKQKLVFTKQS